MLHHHNGTVGCWMGLFAVSHFQHSISILSEDIGSWKCLTSHCCISQVFIKRIKISSYKSCKTEHKKNKKQKTGNRVDRPENGLSIKLGLLQSRLLTCHCGRLNKISDWGSGPWICVVGGGGGVPGKLAKFYSINLQVNIQRTRWTPTSSFAYFVSFFSE